MRLGLYVCQTPRRACTSLWVLLARSPTTSDASEGVVSSGSITGVIFGGPFGSPVTESRSVLGSGASGRRSGAGVGEIPHRHGPSLIGQNASLPQPKSESVGGIGSPQQFTPTAGTWHEVSPQRSWPAANPIPRRGRPLAMSTKMASILIMVKKSIAGFPLTDEPGTQHDCSHSSRTHCRCVQCGVIRGSPSSLPLGRTSMVMWPMPNSVSK